VIALAGEGFGHHGSLAAPPVEQSRPRCLGPQLGRNALAGALPSYLDAKYRLGFFWVKNALRTLDDKVGESSR
jgi:hypothetical protein